MAPFETSRAPEGLPPTPPTYIVCFLSLESILNFWCGYRSCFSINIFFEILSICFHSITLYLKGFRSVAFVECNDFGEIYSFGREFLLTFPF